MFPSANLRREACFPRYLVYFLCLAVFVFILHSRLFRYDSALAGKANVTTTSKKIRQLCDELSIESAVGHGFPLWAPPILARRWFRAEYPRGRAECSSYEPDRFLRPPPSAWLS